MPRRVSLIVFLGFVTTLVLTTGISAGAQSGDGVQVKEAEIAAAQSRLMDIRTEQSAALAAYDSALHEMNELNGQIADATEDLGAAEDRLAEAQDSLEQRAAQVYKSGNLAFTDVMLGVNNFSEFAARMDLWLRLLGEERAKFEAVLEAKNELAAHKDKLEDQRAQRVEAVEEALAQREEAASAEAEAQAYLDSLNGELQEAIQAEQERQAARDRAAVAEALEQAAAEDPEPEVAAVEEAPVVPQADVQAQQAAAEERAAAAQAAAAAAEQEAAEAEERAAQRRAAEQEAAEAEERAARRAEREAAELEAKRAARRAEIERAAAEQAAEEKAAARRAAERRAALAAEEQAAQRRAEKRLAARQEAPATASPTASAPAKRPASARGGGRASCGDDFGGVAPHVAQAGCDIQARFGLTVQGINGSPYHTDGMDLDIYTTDVALGNQVVAYVVDRYSVEYTIWQDVYVNYVTGWKGSGYGHFDHVHVTFVYVIARRPPG